MTSSGLTKKIQSAAIDWQDPGWILSHIDMDNHTSYRRLVRRIFICYNLVFTLDPSCKPPLHIALADYIQKCSGSETLISVLNQSGFCINSDTFREFRVKVVSKLREQGAFSTSLELNPNLFGIVSGDNFDLNFQHSNIRDESGLSKSLHLLGTMMTIPNPLTMYPHSLFEDGMPRATDRQATEVNFTETSAGTRRKQVRSLNIDPIVVPEYPKPSPSAQEINLQRWLSREVDPSSFSVSFT